MVDTCINKNTTFFESLKNLGFNANELAQITNKLNQKKFLQWYGKGKVDSFNQPKLVENIYLINDKEEKISIRDLLNDNIFEARENYKKDLTDLQKIKDFLEKSSIDIATRISAYKDSKYAKTLEELQKELKSFKENEHLKSLTAYYNYIKKTIEDFELRYYKYDLEKGVKSDKSKDAEFKKFLEHTKNFLNNFSNIKNLDISSSSTKEEKEIILKLKTLEDKVTALNNRTNAEIEGVVRDTLTKFISNPEIRKGVIDFLAAQSDEGMIQTWIDAMGDSHNSFLSAIDKFYKKTMYDKSQEEKELLKDWENFIKENGGIDSFNNTLEKVLEKIDGQKTGKFIQKYSESFYNTLYNYVNKLHDLEKENKQETSEYKDLKNEYFKWKKENIEQPFVKSYYDVLNSLSIEARDAKEKIDNLKYEILKKPELSLEDYEQIKNLDDELKNLKSRFYKNGVKKEGKELDIANSLFNYSNKLNSFYEIIGINEKSYEKARKKAEEKGEEYYKNWLENNTTVTPNDAFWKSFRKIMEKFPTNSSLETVNNEIKQLTLPFKNEKGELKVEELPENVKKIYDELEQTKENIKQNLKETISDKDKKEIAEYFKNHISFKPTTEYLKIYSQKNKEINDLEETQSPDSEIYKAAKQKYDKWYLENHELNPYTNEYVPIKRWTKLMPKNSNLLITKPNYKWQIRKIKDEFLNPKYALDNNGFPVPTDNWINNDYKNLNEKELNFLNNLEKRLLYLVEHTKDDIIKKGFLPAIPKVLNKKEKTTFQEITVTESEEIVKFIPFKYIKLLNDETNIRPIPDGASEEEIRTIKEANAKLKKLEHGKAINYNLAETMKTFINVALTNKYKHNIETDLKLFKEQFKHQKIKVTDAQGNNYFNKIKTKLKGENVEHETSAVGSNTEKHFLQWLDAVFYEDFEHDEGWLSKSTNEIQNLTALRALGFNVLSGLNNKLIGNIQARIESAGSIFYDYSHYRNARKLYTTSLTNIISNHKTDSSDNFVDAFLKGFDVLVSQDELTNSPEGKLKTLIEKAKKLKDSSFFLQHIGEHQVQNTTLLAMANSHRIVDGKIITFNEFYENKKNSINFKLDSTLEERDIEFQKISENQDLRETLEEEFKSYTKLIDAYELKDGYLTLKKEINLEDLEIFNFQQRVIGINQNLHGIYNTEDAGLIQRYALGRLAMQFRKWLRPSWNRRFGRRFGKTDYNEKIRAYEQGMYVSSFNFLFTPFKENYKLYKNDKQKTAAKAFKMLVDGFKDSLTNWKIRWHSMSEIEKANCKKTAAEFTFLLASILLAFLFKKLKGEDDDDEVSDKAIIIGLYQCDRIFGELTTFTPIGIVREGNRLFDSPSPVFNTFEDIFKLSTAIALYPFREEEERVFKSGIYHGADKIEVYLKDMIPVYNQFQRLEYMNESNNRYGLLRNNGLIMQMIE